MADDLFTDQPVELTQKNQEPNYIAEARDSTVLILSNNQSDPFNFEKRKTVKEVTAQFESQSNRKNLFEL